MSRNTPTTDPSTGQARSSSVQDSAAAPPSPPHESRDDPATHERSQGLADGNQEVRYYRGFLERLLDLVTHGEEQAVNRMISVIRSGASHDAILATLAELSGEAGHHNNGIIES